jgi:hypothetical protein
MEFLVFLGNGTCLVNPEEKVLDFRGGGGGRVDADAYGEAVLMGQGLDAEDEGRLGQGNAKGKGFAGGGGNVVGGFGKEEGFGTCGGGLLDQLLDLGEIMLEGGCGAELADCLDSVLEMRYLDQTRWVEESRSGIEKDIFERQHVFEGIFLLAIVVQINQSSWYSRPCDTGYRRSAGMRGNRADVADAVLPFAPLIGRRRITEIILFRNMEEFGRCNWNGTKRQIPRRKARLIPRITLRVMMKTDRGFRTRQTGQRLTARGILKDFMRASHYSVRA